MPVAPFCEMYNISYIQQLLYVSAYILANYLGITIFIIFILKCRRERVRMQLTKAIKCGSRATVEHDAIIWDQISLMMTNNGRYMAMTMKPTATPMKTMSKGSMSDVRASRVVSTSMS